VLIGPDRTGDIATPYEERVRVGIVFAEAVATNSKPATSTPNTFSLSIYPPVIANQWKNDSTSTSNEALSRQENVDYAKPCSSRDIS
jgi:hypothetical protein